MKYSWNIAEEAGSVATSLIKTSRRRLIKISPTPPNPFWLGRVTSRFRYAHLADGNGRRFQLNRVPSRVDYSSLFLIIPHTFVRCCVIESAARLTHRQQFSAVSIVFQFDQVLWSTFSISITGLSFGLPRPRRVFILVLLGPWWVLWDFHGFLFNFTGFYWVVWVFIWLFDWFFHVHCWWLLGLFWFTKALLCLKTRFYWVFIICSR